MGTPNDDAIVALVGDKVRVKSGMRDTEYPDMPLGGWAGTISEVDGKGMYTVRWGEETLAAIEPVFKRRCEKDGTVLESTGYVTTTWYPTMADRSRSSIPRRSPASPFRRETKMIASGWFWD